MMDVKNLRFGYRHGEAVLRDVSFQLEDGKLLAILGNNGAGKSTLLKCFNRILKPESGSFQLNGEDMYALPAREIAKRIAFVAQGVPNTQLSVHDVVMLGRRPYMRWGFTENDHKIIHQVMHRLDLEELRGRYLSQLSGGERQKVMLARALAQEPRLLLLDEPTSALDIRNQYKVLQIVRDICHKDGLSAVVVIHDLNLALRFCDRFLLMKDGMVYAYGGHSVLTQEALREVYGVNAHLTETEGHKIILVEEGT